MMEEFKDFEYDGAKYKVSNFGRVFGVRGELKQRPSKDGYLQVTLGSGGGAREKRGSNRRVFRVHRLVALCFIPNPQNKEEVNHIDFDRTNNRVDNLEWTTHLENIKHSAIHNKEVMSTSRSGVNNGRAVYTEDDVRKIRDMYDNGYRIFEIIKEFYPNLNSYERKNKHSRIKDIATRKTFKNVA